MRKCLLMILLTILISNISFAQNAVTLEKGDITPFKGVLLTPERAEKAVKAEKANILLEDLRITQEALTEWHREDAMQQRKKLSEAKWDGFWANVGYFALGAVLTSLTFKVNQKIGDI